MQKWVSELGKVVAERAAVRFESSRWHTCTSPGTRALPSVVGLSLFLVYMSLSITLLNPRHGFTSTCVVFNSRTLTVPFFSSFRTAMYKVDAFPILKRKHTVKDSVPKVISNNFVTIYVSEHLQIMFSKTGGDLKTVRRRWGSRSFSLSPVPSPTHIHILSYSDLHSWETFLLEEGWQRGVLHGCIWMSLFSSFEGLTWLPLSGTLRDGGKRLERRFKAVSHELADSDLSGGSASTTFVSFLLF